MKKSQWPKLFGGAMVLLGTSYAVYVATTWLRYGRPSRAKGSAEDPLLDQFMPIYEVSERHHRKINAPASIVLSTACDLKFAGSPIIRQIFQAREFLMRSHPSYQRLPAGLIDQVRALGWGVLAEIPGREIVMGAITQPWLADVVFHSLPPQEFASFSDPAFVKIAWTLRADPISPAQSIFRTETRVRTGGAIARTKFRKYWALLSPGIILIRLALLEPLKREAERRAPLLVAKPVIGPPASAGKR